MDVLCAATVAADVAECSNQMPCNVHQIGLLLDCRRRRKPLLKMMQKKAHKHLAEDKQIKDLDCWNHILCANETKIDLGPNGAERMWWRPGEDHRPFCLGNGGSVGAWDLVCEFFEGT